jgi:hypothetical protein
MSRLGFRRSLSRLIASVGAFVMISAGVVAFSAVTDAEPAQAADLTQFKPGNMISDALFWNSNAMTAAQIQSFLNDKVPTCRSGYVCLKDYRETTWTSTANPMCSSYPGAANESAATIIDKVARACGVSQKVLLVMLQKEQGLVTHTWPSTWRYTAALGAGCPDTAACDSDYYGFYNQVRYGAYLLKRYTQPSGTGPGTWWDTRFDLMKPVGRVSSILYSPNTACGTRDVYIENQATHALGAAGAGIVNRVALADDAGIDSEENELSNELVGPELEGKRDELLVVRGDDLDFVLLVVGIHSEGGRDVEGAWKVVDDCVEEILDAFVLEGRATGNWNKLVGDGGAADALLEFFE